MQDSIRRIIREICMIDINENIDDKLLRNDLLISSLDYVKIVTLVEDELDIELPDEILVVENDLTVNDFIESVISVMGDRS